jgi:competence protein ComEC
VNTPSRPSDAGGRSSPRAAEAIAVVRDHPRQWLVAGAVAGLLLGPLSRPGVLLAATAFAAVAGRRLLAPLVAVAVLAGAVVGDARLAAQDRTALRPLVDRPVALDLVLLEQPRRSSRQGPAWLGGPSRRALARIAGGRGAGERVLIRAPGRVRWPAARTGAILRVRGRLEQLRSWDGPQRRRGAHAVVRADAVTDTGRHRGGLPGALDAIRERAERGLEAGLARGQAALLRGMVLGQDEQLSEPVREDFRRSGLAHLLAASGQNVTLLAVLALAALTAAGVALRARLAAVLLLIAAYVPLAGGGASIQRAGVMGAAGVLAALAGRPASRWHAVLLAALATLLLNPRSSGDSGWQLSFAAVLAILLLARPLADALCREEEPIGGLGGAAGPRWRGRSRRLRLPRPVADAAAVTLAATLGTAPLIAFHFERASLASVPANLLAAPAVAPVMWLGMLAALAGQVAGAPAALLNALSAYPLGYLGWVAHVTARLPGAAAPFRIGSAPMLAAAYAALLALLAAAARRRVRVAAARAAPGVAVVAVAVALALTALPARGRAGPPAGLRVSFLAVGQGDATLLQHGAHAILVDTGPPDGPVLALLRQAGVERLDALVITHDQADHDGGAASVLRSLPVRALVDGGQGPPSALRRAALAIAARRNIPRIVLTAGQTIRAGPLRLDVLWPRADALPPPPGADPNRTALVAVASDGAFDALLPADAESDVTAALDLPQVEVLKVAHHGSEDPGLAALLERVRPGVAVVPVGPNAYGHPTAQALAALSADVPRVYRTDRDGTVRVDVAANRMTVATGR